MPKTALKHLAIIMDGNGRWAKKRGLSRTKGHEAGAEAIRDITTYCAAHTEIETATFYAFSTENWKRPKLEVEFLMKLLERYLKNELATYQEHGVRFKAIGCLDQFSKALQKCIAKTEELTKDNTNLTQILALNYGSRSEITSAVNKLMAEGKTSVSEEEISQALQTPYTDIDLLIRTSGEQRLSNFLLWQISYAEFAFTPTLWPDFSAEELDTIIHDFTQRSRRFGGL
ncbi:MAG TPA: di-trans,poly-cis-decaprenylcistransferase [Sulfurovum sp.]|nr:di-trans,poly-cis-decaprenylcistransferase [Sulfurovum sp.]